MDSSLPRFPIPHRPTGACNPFSPAGATKASRWTTPQWKREVEVPRKWGRVTKEKALKAVERATPWLKFPNL